MLNIAKVRTGSFTDGPDGPRTVVWFAGCSIRCLDCQNKHLWARNSGIPLPPESAAAQIVAASDGQPITLTGGEPFDQITELYQLLIEIHRIDFHCHIICYTGYTIEELMERWRESWGAAGRREEQLITSVLHMIDVLVDGPYKPILDHDHLQWRGSSNQRAINMPLSIVQGITALDLEQRPDVIVTHDWDTPVIQINDGNVVLTGGLAADLQLYDLGKLEDIPLCGEAGNNHG